MIQDTTSRLASTLTDFSRALHHSADEMNQGQHEVVGGYVHSAATQLEKFSSDLAEGDFEMMMLRCEDAARRKPEAFLAGAVAIGFAIGRFLKSSSRNMNDTYGYESSRGFAEGYAGDYGSGESPYSTPPAGNYPYTTMGSSFGSTETQPYASAEAEKPMMSTDEAADEMKQKLTEDPDKR